MKRKKKTPLAIAKDKLWDVCRELAREMYRPVCYTCGATPLLGTNRHLGHGKSKGLLPLKFQYDMRNLRWQCMRDNMHFGGQSDIFIAKLEKDKEGLKFLKESCTKIDGYWVINKLPPLKPKETLAFINNLITEYEEILK